MTFLESGNYCYNRVGFRQPVLRGQSLRRFWVPDGTIDVTWEGRNHPRWATQAERAAHRATLPAQVLPPPPYLVDQDTTFGIPGVEGPNFEQAQPHTTVFTVAPGVRLVFEKGNFTNVTLPSEVAPEDIGTIQNIQGVLTPTGVPGRDFVRLLVEDETTATFSAALREEIRSGRWQKPVAQGGLGRRLGLVKALAQARRLDPLVRDADLEDLRAENLRALSKYDALVEVAVEGGR